MWKLHPTGMGCRTVPMDEKTTTTKRNNKDDSIFFFVVGEGTAIVRQCNGK